jgi:hypothetical protein
MILIKLAICWRSTVSAGLRPDKAIEQNWRIQKYFEQWLRSNNNNNNNNNKALHWPNMTKAKYSYPHPVWNDKILHVHDATSRDYFTTLWIILLVFYPRWHDVQRGSKYCFVTALFFLDYYLLVEDWYYCAVGQRKKMESPQVKIIFKTLQAPAQ